MKYKVLLAGKNSAVVDDFFTQMNDKFESMTTSMYYEDIFNHLKYFEPDIFVYCLSNDTKDNMNFVKGMLKKSIPFAIIGSEEECTDFIQSTVVDVNIIITKPISAIGITKRILDYLDEQAHIREEAKRLEEERLARERAAKRKHILVVDDDPMMLKLIKEYLHDKYDVATALNGKLALKFLEKKETNLILLDYEMPTENGPAVLEKLRAGETTKDIPVVFLTGITERDKIEKALSLKPQGYLLKPIDINKLLDTIQKYI
jgi:CheY-like chemotaxis protein